MRHGFGTGKSAKAAALNRGGCGAHALLRAQPPMGSKHPSPDSRQWAAAWGCESGALQLPPPAASGWQLAVAAWAVSELSRQLTCGGARGTASPRSGPQTRSRGT